MKQGGRKRKIGEGENGTLIQKKEQRPFTIGLYSFLLKIVITGGQSSNLLEMPFNFANLE